MNEQSKKTEYSKAFIDLVKAHEQTSEEYLSKMEPNPFYIGFGNPNADILILGKEQAFDESSSDYEWLLKNESILNPQQWANIIAGTSPSELDPRSPHGGKAYQKPEGYTWSKYKKLCAYLGLGDFFEHFFISELNQKPSKFSPGSKAVKENILSRLKFFQNDYFNNQFKVIILACGYYLKSSQIEEVFSCKKTSKGTIEISKRNHMTTYYSLDKSKLIIRTRQLSMDVTNDLIEKIAIAVKDHLEIN